MPVPHIDLPEERWMLHAECVQWQLACECDICIRYYTGPGVGFGSRIAGSAFCARGPTLGGCPDNFGDACALPATPERIEAWRAYALREFRERLRYRDESDRHKMACVEEAL